MIDAVPSAMIAAHNPAVGIRVIYRPDHYPVLRSHSGDVHPIRSLLNPPHALGYGDYVWDTAATGPGPVWVRIDLSRQLLSVFRGGDEIGTAVIIYGTRRNPTPIGSFHVLAKAANYHSRTYDAPMPYALRLTADGIALHASPVRDHAATHGCVGMPPEFARLLYRTISLGTPVEILPADQTG